MISVHFQGKRFNITVIQAYALTSKAEKLKLNGSMKTYLDESERGESKSWLKA